MGLGNACPVGLLAPLVAFKHAQQHRVRVDQFRCTGRASIGTLGTRKTLNNYFGQGWGVSLRALGVSALAGSMFDCALT